MSSTTGIEEMLRLRKIEAAARDAIEAMRGETAEVSYSVAMALIRLKAALNRD